jgi:hypothetical protein
MITKDSDMKGPEEGGFGSEGTEEEEEEKECKNEEDTKKHF